MAFRKRIPPRFATLEYLVEVAKDWTLACFAAAENSEFVLIPHRFELCGSAIQRHAISPSSPESASPFDAVRRTPRPTAWSHSAVATILGDGETGTVEHAQEVVEVLALDGDDVLAEVAYVIRIAGLPPLLGPFSSY